MKPLRQAIGDYIKLRRSLGFKLHKVAAHLQDFAAFMELKAAPYVTTELAMEWAMQPADHQPCDWAQRLSAVRVFARHWHATDSRTEIPPVGLLPFRPNVPVPICIRNRRLRSCCQRILGDVGNLPTDNLGCAALWNRGMEATRRRIQDVIDDLRYLDTQAEVLDSLPAQMQRLQTLEKGLEKLDRTRAREVLGVLEKVSDYCQQRRYLEQDNLANTIKNHVRDLLEQIGAAPTKLSGRISLRLAKT